jgi:two-component system response regulator MprA
MSQQPHRVLLVDDDESILESVRCALAGRGYEVLVARDGFEALARAERDSPELIVLDLVMPKRNGLNVLDRLRACNASSPHIIMLTANNEQRHRDFALARGVDAFLAKPFEMEALLEEVDAVFEE